jgi:hypothetical protein
MHGNTFSNRENKIFRTVYPIYDGMQTFVNKDLRNRGTGSRDITSATDDGVTASIWSRIYIILILSLSLARHFNLADHVLNQWRRR